MTPQIASATFVLVILGLFALDRDRNARTSKAVWIPVTWLAIAGSRMVSQWLAATGPSDIPATAVSPGQYLDGSPVDRNVLADRKSVV